MSIFWVKELDQAALLADTFKLSILEHFAEEPRTAKQVAERMNMKQTRLYRHIDALFQGGLLKLVKEQQKRGTVERYYQTVATRFEIDSSLFSTKQGAENETLKMIRSILRDTESELVTLLENEDFQLVMNEEIAPILLRLSVQGTEAQMKSLRQKLNDWLAECEAADSGEPAGKKISFRGLVMFYPTLEQK